jgi:hypothetical protein
LSFDNEAVLVLLGKLSRGADDLVDEPDQIDRLGIQVELAGLDLLPATKPAIKITRPDERPPSDRMTSRLR